jgi:Disulfide bond chaperones of the HSP33 family
MIKTVKPTLDNAVSRFLFEAHDIRGAFVRLTSAWQTMQHDRNYIPAAANLLGDMAAVTTLIASQLKQPGRMTFQAKGDGAVSLLVMDCDDQLRLRGMVRMSPEVSRGDEALNVLPASVPLLLGQGQLILTLEPKEKNQKPYQSIVPLEGATIGDVFAHYLAQSEQQDTWLKLTTTADVCVGLFLQRLPVSAKSKDDDAWNRITMLADTVREDELQQLPVREILKRLFAEEEIRLFPPRKAQYYCPYDREKVVSTLRALGREELERILAEEGEIIVHDEICNHHYRFSADDVEKMFLTTGRELH